MLFPERMQENSVRIREQLFRLDIQPDAFDSIFIDIMDVLKGGTNRKAPYMKEGPHTNGFLYNRIPSDTKGPCTDTLLAYCLDNDSFKECLNNVVRHIAVCPQTRHIVIITSQWNPREWKKNHESYFQQISPRINILFCGFGGLTCIL